MALPKPVESEAVDGARRFRDVQRLDLPPQIATPVPGSQRGSPSVSFVALDRSTSSDGQEISSGKPL